MPYAQLRSLVILLIELEDEDEDEDRDEDRDEDGDLDPMAEFEAQPTIHVRRTPRASTLDELIASLRSQPPPPPQMPRTRTRRRVH